MWWCWCLVTGGALLLVVLLAEGSLTPGGVGARMKVVVVGNWRGSKQQEGPTADQVTCPDLGDLPNNTSYPSTAGSSTSNSSAKYCWHKYWYFKGVLGPAFKTTPATQVLLALVRELILQMGFGT